MSRRTKFQSKRYKPTKLLGQGGMGRVVLAEDQELGRLVAIKIMSSRLRENASAFARFRREARIQARVEHPNVIKLYDWDLDAATPYLVMEVVQGQDLDKVLEEGGPMDPPALLRLAQEVGSGMDALHREGILHRDMKPSNIMIREDGSAVVMDLGLAKAEDVTVLTQTGAMIGTPRFMPPEVFMGEHPWDARADQFQLGAILFQAATGEHYIPGDNLQELGASLQAGVFAKFPPRDPPLPEAFRAAIQRAAAADPARRFPSCAAVGEAMAAEPGRETLELLQELEAEQAARAEAMLSGELGPRPGIAGAPSRGGRGRSAVATFAVLLAVGLGVGWMTARPRPEATPGQEPGAEVGGAPGDAPFGPEVVVAAADEVAALGDLRLLEGRVVEEGGSPLFAIRPDPAVLLQLLPRLPTAQRFHRFVAQGGALERVPATSMARLRDLDRDIRGRGLPLVFFPATRGPPEAEPFRLPKEEAWFRWRPGEPPSHLGGWAGQAVRDYAAATSRVMEMRRDLELWDEERPSGFPDADLLGVNIAAATFRAKRFSREALWIKEISNLWQYGEARRILHPWYRDAHQHLRAMVWSLGQVARHQPEHFDELALSMDQWSHLLAQLWTSPAWALPVEFHLGGPLDSPQLRLLGFQLLVELSARNATLGFRQDLLQEALGRYRVVVEEFPAGSEASGLLLALVTKLLCRKLPAAGELPPLLDAAEERLEKAPIHARASVASELSRVLEFRHQRQRLPPGYADRLARRLEEMVARLRKEGYGFEEGTTGWKVLGHVENQVEAFRRDSGAGR